jgi:hypothetical protein
MTNIGYVPPLTRVSTMTFDLQNECQPYTAKKYILTRSNLFKYAESWKRSRQETHPNEYINHFPSLCKHLTKMIQLPPHKYVFSADFLTRGYRLDRTSAEKMWRIICLPEETTETDIADSIFTGNPDLGGMEEADGIWESQKTNIPGYPFDIQSHPAIIPENDSDSPEQIPERGSDSDF